MEECNASIYTGCIKYKGNYKYSKQLNKRQLIGKICR